jgi:hypothetical protein
LIVDVQLEMALDLGGDPRSVRSLEATPRSRRTHARSALTTALQALPHIRLFGHADSYGVPIGFVILYGIAIEKRLGEPNLRAILMK